MVAAVNSAYRTEERHPGELHHYFRAGGDEWAIGHIADDRRYAWVYRVRDPEAVDLWLEKGRWESDEILGAAVANYVNEHGLPR